MFGDEVFRSLLGWLSGFLLLSGADLILFWLALALVTVGSFRLYRSTRAAGARHVLAAVGGTLIGVLIYVGYLLLIEGDEGRMTEAVFSLYFSLCATLGAYGFLRICNAVSRGR